jgi:hypothetical protein
MDSPFMYGKIARGKDFLDRKAELKQVLDLLGKGICTVITAPRRWGKTSLLHRVAEQLGKNGKRTRCCFIDLCRIHDEQEFLESYVREILKAASDNWQDWVAMAGTYLPGMISSLSVGADPDRDFSIRFHQKTVLEDTGSILDLPERIAGKHKLKFYILMDEFQKLSTFRDSSTLLKRLRSHWEEQKRTTYCLAGSNRQLLSRWFSSPSGPFYRSGDLLFLQKIKGKHWERYIRSRFQDSGKSIHQHTLNRILDLTGGHPYHVPQIAHQLWKITEKEAGQDTLGTCLEELLMNNDIFFRKEVEGLSSLQLGYLTALVNGEAHPGSQRSVVKYRLGSPGNLSTIKAALENKEIIDHFDPKPFFINPLFEYWLREVYLAV